MMKYWTVLVTASLATLLTAFFPLPVARADIFEWEYINPANPSLGKQQSATLAPDGAGAFAQPGAILGNRNLTMAYLIGANVKTYLVYDQFGYVVSYVASNLTAVNLSQADLTNAYFGGAEGYMNEEYTYFPGADLTDANLSHSNLTNAWFDSGILTNANLSGADARGAIFWFATLTGANFTDAEVRGADFSSSGVTAAQLYSTASYRAHDLTGVRFAGKNLAGVNLAAQNLTNADFTSATLTNANFSQANLANVTFTSDGVYGVVDLRGANLSGANLTNAYFAGFDWCGEFGCGTSPGANLTNANLSGADARGADFYLATLSGTNSSNLIQSNGHIAGLDLTAGATLVVRDYDGNPAINPAGPPILIHVDQHLAMGAGSALRMMLDADAWGSTISFSPNIPVSRGGTLELAFATEVNLANQIGRTIDLFDWTGVAPTGTFAVSSPYLWDLSHLYTTGEVSLLNLLLRGDLNDDGHVNAADISALMAALSDLPGYQTTYHLDEQLLKSIADINQDDRVTNADLQALLDKLKSGGGSTDPIPEPSALVLFALTAMGFAAHRKKLRLAQRIP